MIGAGLSDLEEASAVSDDFFGGDEARARRKEFALDRVRAKFGASAIVAGRKLKRDPRD